MDEIFSNPSCSWVVSGGYMLGEQLFFTGPNETFANGDKVVHGQKGMVTGSATSKSHKLKGVKVRFPGNKDWVDCYLYQVSRNPPPRAATGWERRFSARWQARTFRAATRSCTASREW